MDEMEKGRRDRQKKSLGAQGEEIAVQFLQSMGYEILERNFREAHRELDIICREGDDLRFVEVKARREPVQGQAWEAVNRTKLKNIGRAARTYLASEKCHNLGFRVNESHLDVLTVVWSETGEDYVVDYYPDAFLLIYT